MVVLLNLNLESGGAARMRDRFDVQVLEHHPDEVVLAEDPRLGEDWGFERLGRRLHTWSAHAVLG
jgi:hypothetical protein